MDFDLAAKKLEGIPYTSPEKGKILYDWVMELKPRRILELGFAHGVSTCYFAAAAHQLGNCKIDAVDLKNARFSPQIEELLGCLGLGEVVQVHREESSYTWFLKKQIERQTVQGVCEPMYDLCFIDGPKDWTVDGCAFFLVDKLLQGGALLAFDDFEWTYREQEKSSGKPFERGYVFPNLSNDEIEQPQIKAIFELLVKQHPSYSDLEVIDDLIACARKIEMLGPKTLRYTSKISMKYALKKALKRLVG